MLKSLCIRSAGAALLLTGALALTSCGGTNLPAALSADDPYALPETEERVVVSAEKYEAPQITASFAPGIYTEGEIPEKITLSTDSGYVIRYTSTTCSQPTAADQAATGEIRLSFHDSGDKVTKFAVVRAALFDGKEQKGQTFTFLYLCAPEGRFTTPVISLVSDPVGLYGYEEGILVEGKMRDDAKKHGNPKGWTFGNTNANYYGCGIEWERAMNLDFSETGAGAFDLSTAGGMRTNGGWTRANRQKSLKLFCRRDYTPDMGTFVLDLFPGYRDPLTGRTVSFANTILLRGGSNNEGNTVIGTPFQLSMCEGTHLMLPAIRPVTRFINGQYDGVLMALEDYDGDYIEAHYGIPEEDLTFMSGSVEYYGGSQWTLDGGPESELKDWIKTIARITTQDMSKPANYASACEKINMQNFIEYVCVEIYCANSDWPDNNVRVVRYNKDGFNPDAEGLYDGRYRFFLKDLDLAYGFGHSVSNDPFGIMNGGSTCKIRELWNSLMANRDFSEKAYMYMCTLSSAVFTEARAAEVLTEFRTEMAPEMKYTSGILHVGGNSEKSWESNLKGLEVFTKKRIQPVQKFLERHTGRELADLSIHVTGEGKAEIGWFGASDGETRRYIMDMDIPVDLVDGEGADVTVTGGTYQNGVLRLTEEKASVTIAFREKKHEPAGVVLNEVSYKMYDYPFVELYNDSEEAVDLTGWSVGTAKSMENLTGLTIEPHGYLLIANTDERQAAMKFHMTSSDVLVLKNGEETVDSLDLNFINRSIQMGRYPDGGEMRTLYTSELTPGSPNELLPPFDMNN